MSANRRFLLKGMVLGSMTGLAMGSSVSALTSIAVGPTGNAAGRPILALINKGMAESAFMHGAMAASGSRLQEQRVGLDLGFMLNFERRLRGSRTIRMIGLLDDASASLVVDMARSAGARVQWLGQHTAEAGFSRHHLLTTELAEGGSRQLSRQLHACGAGFSLNEERQNGAVVPRQFSGIGRIGSHSGQWATSVGFLLASLGTRPAMAAPVAPATSAPFTGSFVSFSIEA